MEQARSEQFRYRRLEQLQAMAQVCLYPLQEYYRQSRLKETPTYRIPGTYTPCL